MTVLELGKRLLEKDLKDDPVRLCFYNYLKNFCLDQDEVNPELIQNFIFECLRFTYWQEHTEDLDKMLNGEIPHPCLKMVRMASSFQIIHFQHIRDFYTVVKKSIPRDKNVRVRTLPDQEKAMVLLQLSPEHFKATYFQNIFTLHNGQIKSLGITSSLQYDSRLNLSERKRQCIELTENSRAYFYIHDAKIKGYIVRGYLFHKAHSFTIEDIEEFPALHFAIKRIERFYIHRSTDPLYVQTIKNLEGAIENFSLNRSSTRTTLIQMTERAKNLAEYVFPDDKLLRLLVREASRLLTGNEAIEHESSPQ